VRPRNVITIFRKDLIDAIKDARVLLALIVPFGIAILYNFMFEDEQPMPEGTIAYTDVGSEVPQRIEDALTGIMRLEFEPFDSPQEVQQVMADQGATVGLIIPEGFDEAAAAGEVPTLELLMPESPGLSATIIGQVLDDVVRDIADAPPPATIATQTVATDRSNGIMLFEVLGLRRYFILAALMMLISMISMMAVPIILAEEAEKKTLEALTLIASYVDVIVAKALVGIVYLTLGTGLLLGLTQSWPVDPLTFFSGVMLLGLALVGFGLLLGGLFKSANQLNNWGGLILLPVVAPAFIVGVWTPGVLRYIIEAIPVAQGMKLAVNGMSGETIFANIWLSYAILAGWIVIAYGAVVWRLSRLRG
jgi:ABC-type Na+ efflux pump permease subunit